MIMQHIYTYASLFTCSWKPTILLNYKEILLLLDSISIALHIIFNSNRMLCHVPDLDAKLSSFEFEGANNQPEPEPGQGQRQRQPNKETILCIHLDRQSRQEESASKAWGRQRSHSTGAMCNETKQASLFDVSSCLCRTYFLLTGCVAKVDRFCCRLFEY